MTTLKKALAGVAVVVALTTVFCAVGALESGAIDAANALLVTVAAAIVETVALKALN